jgi:hypothetical protein
MTINKESQRWVHTKGQRSEVLSTPLVDRFGEDAEQKTCTRETGVEIYVSKSKILKKYDT